MGDYSGSWDRTAADDVLDYAMGLGLLGTGLLTIAFISLGLPVLSTVIGMSIIGGLWVFTITPHIVAHWLNVSVDDLLGIPRSSEIHIPTDDPQDSDTAQNETRA